MQNMMENADVARKQKLVFFLANAVFVIQWSALCVRLIQHWHFVRSDLRADIQYLAVIYALLWINLLIEKAKSGSLGLVCASFLGVQFLVFRLF